MQYLLGIGESQLFLDILLHVGTLGAIVIFFRQYLYEILADTKKLVNKEINFDSSKTRIGIFAFAACVPSMLVVLLFKGVFVSAFSSVRAVAVLLILNGCLLFASRFIRYNDITYEEITLLQALIIGSAQCLAILPGISRSGMTITCGLLCGLSPRAAFRFSFIMAIPSILGALIVQFRDVFSLTIDTHIHYSVGMIIAGIVGFLALLVLQRIITKHRLHYFSVYCLCIGILLFVIH